MFYLVLNILRPNGSESCLGGFICANSTFVSIYGVIFTIVISLGVYIYGLQNKSEKITLIQNTSIKTVISYCIGFFAISFFFLPSPLYEILNFILVATLIFGLFVSFVEIFKFNKNELSAEKAVKKFKEEVIKGKLKDFEDLKIRNNSLNKEIEEREKSVEIKRFLLDESREGYYLIRAQRSGYITNVDLNVLFSKDIVQIDQEVKHTSPEKLSFFIPYSISNGAPIDVDTIIFGVKDAGTIKIPEENWKNYVSLHEGKWRNFVSIGDEYENPSSYLEAEIRSYYSQMFSLIKLEDATSLELKLKEFSSFVDHFTDKADSYADIIQFINTDIIYPLQKYTFKRGDLDCIRKITSFSLGYVYQSLDKESIQTFNIFSRNLTNAFYQSFDLNNKSKSEFHDIYFRWLKEISEFSIKPRLQKGKIDSEFAINFLSNLNALLKIAFDKKDLLTFEKTINVLNRSFRRETYEYGEDNILDKIVLTKKAVIFGFTSWAYKYFGVRKNEEFYKAVLDQLLNTLRKDPIYYHGNAEDDLNYYLSIYLETVKISESRGSFGWDTWDMPEGEVYTVTVRQDIKNLLADRILKISAADPTFVINIRDRNYSDELPLIREGSQEFDPLFGKTKEFFISTEKLSDEQFRIAKDKYYNIFAQVNKKYEVEVKTKLIEQSIDEVKFNKFAEQNFNSYAESRVLNRIKKFDKYLNKKMDGFGYNLLLDKAQFVKETNVHYVDQDQLGENLARSEDNRILEAILKKFPKINSLEKSEIEHLATSKNDIKAIVLWVNGYIGLENGVFKDFEPYWRESDSRKTKGHSYQGSLAGVPVYMIFKSDEYKSHPDTGFAFSEAAFSITEFELERDSKLDASKTKWAENSSECIILSITDLSMLENDRIAIVDSWIAKDPTSVSSREEKIEELKTNVLLKFYKGLSVDSLSFETNDIHLFNIK